MYYIDCVMYTVYRAWHTLYHKYSLYIIYGILQCTFYSTYLSCILTHVINIFIMYMYIISCLQVSSAYSLQLRRWPRRATCCRRLLSRYIYVYIGFILLCAYIYYMYIQSISIYLYDISIYICMLQVFIASIGEGLVSSRMRIAKALWMSDISAEYSHQESPKFKRQLDEVLERQIPFMVCILYVVTVCVYIVKYA